MFKKAIAVVLVLACMFALCAQAFAAHASITATPAELLAGGSVNLRFRIANDTASSMMNISISGPGVNYSGADTVPAGQTLDINVANVTVGTDQLGVPLAYQLVWTDENGFMQSETVNVTIGKLAGEITATYSVDNTSPGAEDKVTFTFDLTNPTSEAVTNLSIRDSALSDDPLASGISIAAGASQRIQYEYAMGNKSVTAEPVISYTLAGETKTLTLEKTNIALVISDIELTVSMGENAQEGVLFTIVTKNVGNQDISDITLRDELGNLVNETAFALQAGSEKTLSFLVKTDTVRNVSFTLTGKDALGRDYEAKTESFETHPYVDPSLVTLSLTLSVQQALAQDGSMVIRFIINNDSSVEITDAVITESQLGEVKTIGALPMGQTSVDVRLQVGAPRELVFALSASDPSGTSHVANAKVTAAYVQAATPVPSATTEPEEASAPKKSGVSGTLLTLLIVFAALMVLAGIALLILTIYERRNRKRSRTIDTEDDFADTKPSVRPGKGIAARANQPDLVLPPHVRNGQALHETQKKDYSRSAQRLYTEPVQKPAEREMRPAQRLYTEPVQKPAEKETRPAQRLYTEPVQKPAGKETRPAQRLYTEPVQKPAEKEMRTAQNLHSEPVQKPADDATRSVQSPRSAPVQNPQEREIRPVQRPNFIDVLTRPQMEKTQPQQEQHAEPVPETIREDVQLERQPAPQPIKSEVPQQMASEPPAHTVQLKKVYRVQSADETGSLPVISREEQSRQRDPQQETVRKRIRHVRAPEDEQ